MPSTDKARINSIGLDGSASHRRLCVPMGFKGSVVPCITLHFFRVLTLEHHISNYSLFWLCISPCF